MKKIYIYQGDENRAKIEEGLREDIFFADVYKRAEEILRELLEESKEYKNITEKVDCENTQYQRMGNNIIAFCASRGQGKTSAMKSFAKYLSNGYEDNNRILDKRIPVENSFVVLDSVDPAALDSGESLIRVVISRIFYLLEKKCGDNYNYFRSSQEKNRLLELFQECYGGIDYLRGKKQRDDSQDDLECLAALGNSARLKMNLIELINLFLRIYTRNGAQTRDEDARNRFLVVPIDDVDICTADIYGCCEEIRNYLTLPNVIVLLAADYEQLHRVILQKYLQINRGVVEYEPAFKKECIKQASVYLLKLLPNNHVIDLPEYGSIPESVWKGLKLVYYKRANGTEAAYADMLEETSKVCDNLQQQIIKIIYDRTGVILWDDGGGFSRFVPQNMRELTQLIKKMTKGPEIDFRKLYRLDLEGEPLTDEEEETAAGALLNNIYLFKSFFLDNWCINNMTPMQFIELRDWIRALEKRKRSGIFDYKLDDMLERKESARDEGGKEAYSLGDDRPPGQIPWDYIAMYLTIFLNEWFAEALLDKEQYKRIAAFLDGENSLLQYPMKHYPENPYNIFYFQIEEDWFEHDNLKGSFLEHFCSENGDKRYFDFFSPWRNTLLGGFKAEPRPIDEEGNNTPEADNAGDEYGKRIQDMLLPLKTIISNCGIYCHFREKIKRDFWETTNNPNWRQTIKIFFEEDTWLRHLDFLRLVPNNLEILSQHYLSMETTWYGAFLANPENLRRYVEEYLESKSRIFGDADIKDEELSEVLADWENNNWTSFAGIIRRAFLEDCVDRSQLRELVVAQQIIASKRREVDELLSHKIETEADIKKARKLIAEVREEYQRAIKEPKSAQDQEAVSGKAKSRKSEKKEPAGQKGTAALEEEITSEEADNSQTDEEQ
jgi:hypothetical protein